MTRLHRGLRNGILLSIPIWLLMHSVCFGATYYMRADGSAANKAAATGPCGTVANTMSIATHDADTYSADDIILLCDDGGIYRDTMDPPSDGSAGHLITYRAAPGDTPKIYGSTQQSTWVEEESSAHTDYTADANAQGVWLFEDDPGALLDSSGEGNTLSDTGTVPIGTASPPGTYTTKYAGIFDASTQYLSRANASLSANFPGKKETANFSVAFWFKRGSTGDSYFRVIGMYGSADASRSWNVQIYTDKIRLCLQNGATGSNLLSTTAFNNTNWNHVVVVYDGGLTDTDRVKFYINGNATPEKVTCALTSITASNTLLYIGRNATDTSYYYDGYLDEIAVFDRALTADEAVEIYSFGLKPLAPVSAWYKESVSTSPSMLWFVNNDGTVSWGHQETLKASLNTQYDWWWDDSNDRLYVYGATDPATDYTSIESGTREFGISAVGRSYLMFDGLEVAFCADIANAENGKGIGILSYNTVQNCTVYHIAKKEATGGFGVTVRGQSNLITTNTIHDCGRRAVSMSYSSGTLSNNIVEHNQLYNNYHSTVDTISAGTITVSGNIIRYNHIYWTDGFDAADVVGGVCGIYTEGAAGREIDNQQIYDNVIVNNDDVGILIGVYTTDAEIYNNTIYKSHPNGHSANRNGIKIAGSGTSGIIIKNNIAMDNYGAQLFIVDAADVSVCENNLWFHSSGGTQTFTSVAATAYHFDDQAAYQAATGFDDTGLWANPLFVSTTDLHLRKTSPAKNAGADVGLTTDFEGKPIRGLPDIGAYELQGGFAAHLMKMMQQ